MASTQAGQRPLDVVIVSAFDRAQSRVTGSDATRIVNNLVYWFVHEKLYHLAPNSRLGYVGYITNKLYEFDMRQVFPPYAPNTVNKSRQSPAYKVVNCPPYGMACGLSKAHELIRERQNPNGVILLFYDGQIYGTDFMDGAGEFVSSVPVHTFIANQSIYGPAFNTRVLEDMVAKSPGGKYHPDYISAPKNALTPPFAQLLESILLSNFTAIQDDVQKVGPWGGSGGTAYEIQQPDQLPRSLESITIYAYSGVIQSIEFSYIDQAGQKQIVSPWGGNKGKSKLPPIQLGSSVTVKEIYGATGASGGNIVLKSLTIVTDADTYGPYGKISWGNTQFHVAAPDNHSIVGFYGRADGQVVYQIGAYVCPN